MNSTECREFDGISLQNKPNYAASVSICRIMPRACQYAELCRERVIMPLGMPAVLGGANPCGGVLISFSKSVEPLSSVGNGIDPHRFAKCALILTYTPRDGFSITTAYFSTFLNPRPHPAPPLTPAELYNLFVH